MALSTFWLGRVAMNPEYFYKIVIALLLTTWIIIVSLIVACATAYRFLEITFVTNYIWIDFAIFIFVFVAVAVIIYRGISKRLDGHIIIEISPKREKKDARVV